METGSPFLCWLWSTWFRPRVLRPWFFLKYSGSSFLVILDDLVTNNAGRHGGWGACVVLLPHYSEGAMEAVGGSRGEETLLKTCLIAWRCYTQSHEQGAGRFGVKWVKVVPSAPGSQDANITHTPAPPSAA